MWPISDFLGISFPTYLVIISFSYCLAIAYSLWRARKMHLDYLRTLDFAFIIMIFGFWGARLGHVYFEDWLYYRTQPIAIFYFWQGGFVFYFGALAAAFATWVWAKKKQLSYFAYADLFAPVILLGYALGRIACFSAGCCYGKICHLPWAVNFPPGSLAPSSIAIHPTQLYASLWSFVLLLVFLWIEKGEKARRKKYFSFVGHRFFFVVLWSSLGRIVMEIYRDDDRGTMPFGYSSAIWISLILSLLSLFFIYKQKKIMSKAS